jgi:hypothetical protein
LLIDKEKTMANRKLFTAMLAMALVLGITAVGCSKSSKSSGSSSGGGGTFTITGIPSEYDGKYAYLTGMGGVVLYYGFQSLDTSTNVRTLPRISNGKASLPMWSYIGGLGRFSGNETFDVTVSIIDSSEVTNSGIDPVTYADFKSVKFSKGSAAKAWKDKE